MHETRLVTYAAPAGMVGASDYKVEVNGIPLFLYQAKVNFMRIPDMDLFPEFTPFGYFDMQGEVTVKVTAAQKIDFVDIRPKSYRIHPVIEGNTIRFQLTEPRKVSIEFNGDLHRTLHLFANPIETDTPARDDPNVVYFAPGIHHAGVINLESNKTVYLAGGAYVYGIVRGDGAVNTGVRGRGILSAEKAPWPDGAFQVKNCHSLTMRDFILLDSAGWSVKIDGCEEVLLDNFKEICCRRNCDGIDLCSTKNAVVNDCFVRNWDDALCVKGVGNGDSRHTVVTNCVFWSDAAQSIEIGYETQMEKMEDVFIKNIDIIHHLMPGYMCITVHNGDRAAIRNLHFEDIRIEDTVAPLFDIWVDKAHWNRDEKRGSVKGVHYKNISLIGGVNPDVVNKYKDAGEGGSEISYLAAQTSRIAGFDASHGVEDVTFENVNVLGQYLSSLEEGHFQVNAHVKNVRFIPPADGSPVICYTMEPATLANPPVKVDFDATKSFGQGAEIVSYAWSFGDGEAASGAIASHTYTKAGSYTVELAIQDALSRSARIMRLITILPYYDAVNLSNAVAGLNYKYAEGDFNFGSNFDAITSLAGGVTAGISLPERMRQGYYVVVYEGLIEVPVDGIYRFFVGMEFATGYEMLAGGAIYVHDRLLSSNNSGWGQIGLKAGLHPVRAILFKKSNAKQVEFKYMGPGIAAQEIPAEVFYH